MDAYDISMKIRHLWAENYDRNSGGIKKAFGYMPVYVNGKPITKVVYQDDKIELLTDTEQCTNECL